jgi:hypothetical protein
VITVTLLWMVNDVKKRAAGLGFCYPLLAHSIISLASVRIKNADQRQRYLPLESRLSY